MFHPQIDIHSLDFLKHCVLQLACGSAIYHLAKGTISRNICKCKYCKYIYIRNIYIFAICCSVFLWPGSLLATCDMRKTFCFSVRINWRPRGDCWCASGTHATGPHDAGTSEKVLIIAGMQIVSQPPNNQPRVPLIPPSELVRLS